MIILALVQRNTLQTPSSLALLQLKMDISLSEARLEKSDYLKKLVKMPRISYKEKEVHLKEKPFC